MLSSVSQYGLVMLRLIDDCLVKLDAVILVHIVLIILLAHDIVEGGCSMLVYTLTELQVIQTISTHCLMLLLLSHGALVFSGASRNRPKYLNLLLML